MILRYTQTARTNPSYGIVNRLIIPVGKFDRLVKKNLVIQKDDYLVANVWATFDNFGVASKVVFQKSYGKPKPGEDLTNSLNAWILLL